MAACRRREQEREQQECAAAAKRAKRTHEMVEAANDVVRLDHSMRDIPFPEVLLSPEDSINAIITLRHPESISAEGVVRDTILGGLPLITVRDDPDPQITGEERAKLRDNSIGFLRHALYKFMGFGACPVGVKFVVDGVASDPDEAGKPRETRTPVCARAYTPTIGTYVITEQLVGNTPKARHYELIMVECDDDGIEVDIKRAYEKIRPGLCPLPEHLREDAHAYIASVRAVLAATHTTVNEQLSAAAAEASARMHGGRGCASSAALKTYYMGSVAGAAAAAAVAGPGGSRRRKRCVEVLVENPNIYVYHCVGYEPCPTTGALNSRIMMAVRAVKAERETQMRFAQTELRRRTRSIYLQQSAANEAALSRAEQQRNAATSIIIDAGVAPRGGCFGDDDDDEGAAGGPDVRARAGVAVGFGANDAAARINGEVFRDENYISPAQRQRARVWANSLKVAFEQMREAGVYAITANEPALAAPPGLVFVPAMTVATTVPAMPLEEVVAAEADARLALNNAWGVPEAYNARGSRATLNASVEASETRLNQSLRGHTSGMNDLLAMSIRWQRLFANAFANDGKMYVRDILRCYHYVGERHDVAAGTVRPDVTVSFPAASFASVEELERLVDRGHLDHEEGGRLSLERVGISAEKLKHGSVCSSAGGGGASATGASGSGTKAAAAAAPRAKVDS